MNDVCVGILQAIFWIFVIYFGLSILGGIFSLIGAFFNKLSEWDERHKEWQEKNKRNR